MSAMDIGSALLWILAVGVCVPITAFAVECAAALLPTRARAGKISVTNSASHLPDDLPRIAVLIPAQNEAAGIAATLATIMAQVRAHDRVVVIADNCCDNTAEVARALGAEVIERGDVMRTGKSYALDFGLRHLELDPPQVVLVVDADAVVAPDALAMLARATWERQQPVQGVNLCDPPAAPTPNDVLSAFAIMVKNLVRPLGLARLGLPCLLTGCGMAFPWAIARSTNFANGKLAEDLWLSVELARSGYMTTFCAESFFGSRLPKAKHEARRQRTRWEHGHLETLSQVPRLLYEAVRFRRWELLSLALELGVPPLSLLVMLWFSALFVMTSATAFGFAALLAAILFGVGILLISIIGGVWWKFGRARFPLRALLFAPLYALSKIPLYFRFWRARETIWIRAERDA
jgi:cellulose synthase/poly-beta-1,6-N-acetylglucosamine synthase-like glycosyltransferase